jgi:hypothetical protein
MWVAVVVACSYSSLLLKLNKISFVRGQHDAALFHAGKRFEGFATRSAKTLVAWRLAKDGVHLLGYAPNIIIFAAMP